MPLVNCPDCNAGVSARATQCLQCGAPLTPTVQPYHSGRSIKDDLRPTKKQRNEVVVVNVDMPLWSIVQLLVKWAIAAIPASLILLLFGYAAVLLLRGLAKH